MFLYQSFVIGHSLHGFFFPQLELFDVIVSLFQLLLERLNLVAKWDLIILVGLVVLSLLFFYLELIDLIFQPYRFFFVNLVQYFVN